MAGEVRNTAFDHAPEEARDVLLVMDGALDDHRHWMTRWHKGVVCRLTPEADIVAEDPHRLTRLGSWLETYRDQGLMQQTAFHDLEASFVELTGFARFLAIRSQDGLPIPPEEYDALREKEERFVLQARRIQDAFRKAVSELDPLTGLHNRQVMLQELTVEFERAQRTGSPLAVALADIDFFKRVNDDHGHAAGDQVLVQAAGRFLSRLRPYDSIYRYGGEEFLLVLPNANPGTAISVLERLRHALADQAIGLEDGRELPVTSSFGMAMVDSEASMKEVIERADTALYHAKENGRNRVSVWKAGMEKDG